MHRLILLAAFASLSAGLAQASSLYERMGGAPVVTAVVGETIDGVLADPLLAKSFKDANIARNKRTLAEQFCLLAGGGCRYSGDPMRAVHAGHHISEAEFYGLVEMLRAALIRHGVALSDRNQLLALLAPMKRDVVNVPVPTAASTPTEPTEPGAPAEQTVRPASGRP
jgi:hemoglobin